MNKLINKVINILFILSLPFLTLCISNSFAIEDIRINIILTFVCGIILIIVGFRNFFEKINTKILLLSIYFSCAIGKLLLNFANSNLSFMHYYLDILFHKTFSDGTVKIIIYLLSLPSLIIFVYSGLKYILPIIKKEILSLTHNEKKYLGIVLIIGFVLTTILYKTSNIYYQPAYNGNPFLYDVIYTTDTAYIYGHNAYLNPTNYENDLRQPFFGILSLPFASVSYILAQIFFFIPNAYAVILNTMQILLLALSILMLSRMLHLKESDAKLYWIFSFSCFPVLIFSFVMEQYIFAVFYLILALYIYYERKEIKTNYAYLGAVGSLLTSGIIFPVISNMKNFKKYIMAVLKCFCIFVLILIVIGQFPIILHLQEKLNILLNFTGEKLSFIEKFQQYLYFARSLFLAPRGVLFYTEGIPRYGLVPISHFSITGISVLLLCIISTILNRKNKIAILSGLWIIFSFILLCIVGWGTAENGLILYGLYFLWAFVTLIYLLIDKLIQNIKLKKCIIISSSIFLFIFNVIEFLHIIKFGIDYYGG